MPRGGTDGLFPRSPTVAASPDLAFAVRRGASNVKLVYTSDQMPGYRRLRWGTGFSYRFPDGSLVTDRGERKRILSLAVPPAYERVWICMRGDGHLQATGYDARGRKQYLYHPAWHEIAASRKFDQLTEFAATLPKIRAAVKRELSREELTRERAIAGVVSLLDLTGYRIGNARYERDNGTHGISSLLARHLKEEDGELLLRFSGKSGQSHRARISHPRLTRLLSELQDLPGQHLFRYEDGEGRWHDIGTSDVNRWIQDVGGGEYTAKQFRTWKATVLCAKELGGAPPPEEKGLRQQRVREAIDVTATRLNHSPTTCRKYYIHPGLLSAYRKGMLHRVMHGAPPRLRKRDGSAGLQAVERRVFKVLESEAA